MTGLQNKSFSPDRKPFFPPAFALKLAANVTSVTVSVAHLAIIKKYTNRQMIIEERKPMETTPFGCGMMGFAHDSEYLCDGLKRLKA